MNNIKSDCLKIDISRKYNVNIESIDDDILQKIERIVWQRKKANDELNDYDIEDLRLLKNLKACTFMKFIFSDADIEKLNSLLSLNYIYFDFCEFKAEQLNFNEKVETLIFNVCKNLNESKLKNSNVKKIKIVSSKRDMIQVDILNFEKLNYIEELSLNNCYVKNVKDILLVAPNIKYLNLDGSEVENREELEKFDIEISQEEEYHLAGIN